MIEIGKACSPEQLYTQISNLDSLIPSAKVNMLFSRLVSYAIDENNKTSFEPTQIINLQQRCMEAECEMEKYWAQRVIDSGSPEETLKDFPYYNNYQRLTALEWANMSQFYKPQDRAKALFVGGGSLPLTSIVLAEKHQVESTIIDFDLEAVANSTQLLNRLGLSDRVRIHYADGQTFNGYGDFPAIYLAAIAGFTEQQKATIFAKVKHDAKPDTLILARTVHGNREWLYPKLQDHLFSGFSKLVEVHPHDDIVNSFVIMSPKQKAA